MNVTKLLISLLLLPFLIYSQNIKEDAYFILNKNEDKYILKHAKRIAEYDTFSLYDKKEYKERQKK